MKERSREQAALTFKLLCEAAEEGERCPTNQTLAPQLGCSPARASQMLIILEGEGKIEVQRQPKARVIKIIATGERTAGPWYDAAQAKPLAIPRLSAPAPVPSPQGLPTAPARCPCFFCGVPGFKGCEHWAPSLPSPNQLPVPPSRDPTRIKNINSRWT